MTVEDDLIAAMERVALDDIMTMVVERMNDVRHASLALERRGEDAVECAVALHQLSVGLDRLQHHVARSRDRKVTRLHNNAKMSYGRIGKKLGLPASLVVKMVKRGAR